MRTMIFVLVCTASCLAQVPSAGQQLWLKADTGVTTAGGLVTSWIDQSPSAHVFTPPAGAEPTFATGVVNGLPAVGFDGTMQLDGGIGQTLGDATVFTLARYTVSSDNDYLYAIGTPGTSGSQMCLARSAGTTPYHYDGAVQNTSNSPYSQIAANEWKVFVQSFHGSGPSSHDWFMNADNIMSTSANNPYNVDATNISIGNWSSGNYRFEGELIEMIVYDRVLSEAEQLAVQDYLRQRAGLPVFIDDSYWDLSTWSVIQYEMNAQPDAQWVLYDGNRSVDQLVNCDPSIFLGDFDAQNTVMRGRMGSGSAPDYMGFVFGYQDRGHYYLFDWKKTTASYQNFGVGDAGMTLRVIDVVGGGDPTGADLWGSAPTPNATTLFDDPTPWVNGVDYDFEVTFTPGNFRIIISETVGGAVLADWTSTNNRYVDGRFGYYVNSLQYVRFGQVTVEGAPVAAGCGPKLSAWLPLSNHLWRVKVSNASPGIPGKIYYSPPGATPTPWPWGPCSIYLDLTNYAVLLHFVTDATGKFSFDLVIPPSSTFHGSDWILQAAVNPPGLANWEITNPVSVMVQ